MEQDEASLKRRVEALLNSAIGENGSNTPDFILAEYLMRCLSNWDITTKKRDKWYSVHLEPCNKYFEDERPSDKKDCAMKMQATE